MLGPLIPNLWFDTQAEEAAAFYVSIFPSSRIVRVLQAPPGSPFPEGHALSVEWEIDGQRFIGINGGPQFTFDEAVSFMITCADQAEVDGYWDALLADGGEESMCGWLKDKFGVSWQVVPAGLDDLLADPDPGRAKRATDAMLTMRKLDIAALRAAADG